MRDINSIYNFLNVYGEDESVWKSHPLGRREKEREGEMKGQDEGRGMRKQTRQRQLR